MTSTLGLLSLEKIMNERISYWFKMLSVESYDGSTDPIDHLKGYKILIGFQGVSDAILCLAFLATLKKVTRM